MRMRVVLSPRRSASCDRRRPRRTARPPAASNARNHAERLHAADYNLFTAMTVLENRRRPSRACSLSARRARRAPRRCRRSRSCSADGRVTVGGDVSASFGSDDPGFFNYTDYEHSALRHAAHRRDRRGEGRRRTSRCSARSAPRTSTPSQPVRALPAHPAVDDARLRHPGRPRAADLRRLRAAHLRHRQPADRLSARLSVPHVAAARRAAGERRRTAAECAAAAGCASYSIGNPTPDQRRAAGQRVPLGHGRAGARDSRHRRARPAAVTPARVSNPLFTDDNDGRQLAGRVELRPLAGLILGASLARAAVRRPTPAARGAVGDGHDGEFTQTAWGGDVEYSRDYYLRARSKRSSASWRAADGARAGRSTRAARRALATSLEGRYKLRPGLYVAGADRSSRLQRDRPATLGTRHVGRAGDARRDRRRLFASSAICC